MRWWSSVALVSLVCACGPGASTSAGSEGGSASTVSDDSAGSAASSSSSSTSTSSTSSSTSSSSSSTTACDFICDVDIPDANSCDPFAQDCPEGQKCAWWDPDGGNAWASTHCVPIAPQPLGLGETCYEYDFETGADDCDKGMLCYNLDEQGVGTCVGLCEGENIAPTCVEPCTACHVYGTGFSVCLPARCDPLQSECPDGQICTMSYSFACMPPDPEGPAGPGEPCSMTLSGVCAEGLVCADAEHVPGCRDFFCCTEFCELAAPNTCPEGQQCITGYWHAIAPGCGYEQVGMCGVEG